MHPFAPLPDKAAVYTIAGNIVVGRYFQTEIFSGGPLDRGIVFRYKAAFRFKNAAFSQGQGKGKRTIVFFVHFKIPPIAAFGSAFKGGFFDLLGIFFHGSTDIGAEDGSAFDIRQLSGKSESHGFSGKKQDPVWRYALRYGHKKLLRQFACGEKFQGILNMAVPELPVMSSGAFE